MADKKAALYKVLAVCLAAFLAVSFFLHQGIEAKAIDTNVPGLTWNNLTAHSTVNFTRIVSPSDVHWIEIGATGKNGYCAYDTYMEADMVFTFYASGSVSHLSPGNLEYYFSFDDLSSYYRPKVEFLNASYDYSLIMAGNEYPLPALQGWVTLPSIYPVNTYITLKVHFSGLVRLKSDSVSTSADGYKLGETVDFKADLLRWKVHPIGDTVSDIKGLVTANNDMLNRLVNGNAGIQGAIEHQTQQQHEDALKEQQLQEEANALQKEENETQKGILDKITDFFGNFFKNLGDFLLGLIVPSSEELSVFLEEVNAWFGDRLGFIWYPFDLALRLVDALATGEADTSFQVPPLKLDLLGSEYTIYEGGTVELDVFGFFKYVRMFTSFMLVSGVVRLAVDKWNEWIGGRSG